MGVNTEVSGPGKRGSYKKGNILNNNRFSYLNPQTAVILTNDGPQV